jgi:hypothetical protein
VQQRSVTRSQWRTCWHGSSGIRLLDFGWLTLASVQQANEADMGSGRQDLPPACGLSARALGSWERRT